MKNILRKFIPRIERTYFPHPDSISKVSIQSMAVKCKSKIAFCDFFLPIGYYPSLNVDCRVHCPGYLCFLVRLTGFCPRFVKNYCLNCPVMLK